MVDVGQDGGILVPKEYEEPILRMLESGKHYSIPLFNVTIGEDGIPQYERIVHPKPEVIGGE